MAKSIAVQIERRAEGYVLALQVPHSVIEHLAQGGQWSDTLDDFVPLNEAWMAMNDQQPEFVRVQIDVVADE